MIFVDLLVVVKQRDFSVYIKFHPNQFINISFFFEFEILSYHLQIRSLRHRGNFPILFNDSVIFLSFFKQ